MANITFYELSEYTKGNRVPVQINLDYIDSNEEFLEVLQEEIHAVGGEEWIVADFEGVPPHLVSEHDLLPEFFDYKSAVEEHGEEAVQAALALEVPLEAIPDSYAGHFGDVSEEEALANYARHIALESGDLQEIPAKYESYIDWRALGRDMRLHGEARAHNGHVFTW